VLLLIVGQFTQEVFVKLIHLDGVPAPSITVSDEGYEEIVALVMQYRRCRKRGCTFSENNPVVVVNLCLGCFIEEHKELRYVSAFGEPDEEGRQTYKFLDDEGYVWFSIADRSDSPNKNLHETLTHWGFSVPAYYTHPKHGDHRLWPLNWRIYGQIPTASVLVVENRYDSKLMATFLVYRGGTFKELTKKNGETKLLLQRAQDAIAATKDAEGWYHVGQYPTKWISEAKLYEVISEMESAVYDGQVKLRNNGQKEELTA